MAAAEQAREPCLRWCACRSWVVMDGLRSSLMAENVAGRNPVDVLNGVCARRPTAPFSFGDPA